MLYLTVDEVLAMHELVLEHSGGDTGVRDYGMLESAVMQPSASFGGDDLYPTLFEKAAAIAYSLVMNHPFSDGNKRIGWVAMDTFLRVNGFVLRTTADDGERLFLSLAAGDVSRDDLRDWIRRHAIAID